jgi:hypothetical protein
LALFSPRSQIFRQDSSGSRAGFHVKLSFFAARCSVSVGFISPFRAWIFTVVGHVFSRSRARCSVPSSCHDFFCSRCVPCTRFGVVAEFFGVSRLRFFVFLSADLFRSCFIFVSRVKISQVLAQRFSSCAASVFTPTPVLSLELISSAAYFLCCARCRVQGFQSRPISRYAW